jgi:hypothetical protein
MGVFAILLVLVGGGCSSPALRSGWESLVAEDYEGAIPILLTAVEEDPDDWKPRMYLGLSYAEAGDRASARQQWVAALNRTREDRFWNEVVEVMEAYGLDSAGDEMLGVAGDTGEKRTAVKSKIASEDPGTRHMAKFVWWGVAAILIGASIAAGG